MISLFSRVKTASANCRLGISIDAENVAVCVARRKDQGYQVERCHKQAISGNLTDTVKSLLKSANIPRCETNISLAMADSRFHKIQKPAVPEEEMDMSAMYLIKDRLSQGMEDSMVASLYYPPGCRHDDQMMAVEVSHSRVRELVTAVQAAGLDINAVDVMELNLGEILAQDDAMQKGIAILVEHAEGVTLLIYRNEDLYLIRRLQDVSDLTSCLPAPGNAQMADMLLLEVQRTLDYYDSLMGQPLPTRLYLAPGFVDLAPLADYINANLAPAVEVLDLNLIFDLAEPLDSGTQGDVLGAVAASLREVSA